MTWLCVKCQYRRHSVNNQFKATCFVCKTEESMVMLLSDKIARVRMTERPLVNK
jgi:hypothetical protein